MFTLIVILHLIVCFLLVVAVLMQSGKGGGLTGAFGMGGNATVFGGRGAVDFLGKATWVLGGTFMVTSLLLAILAGANTGSGGSLIRQQSGGAPGNGSAPASAPVVPGGEIPSGDTPGGSPAGESGVPGGTFQPSATEPPATGAPATGTPATSTPATSTPAPGGTAPAGSGN